MAHINKLWITPKANRNWYLSNETHSRKHTCPRAVHFLHRPNSHWIQIVRETSNAHVE